MKNENESVDFTDEELAQIGKENARNTVWDDGLFGCENRETGASVLYHLTKKGWIKEHDVHICQCPKHADEGGCINETGHPQIDGLWICRNCGEDCRRHAASLLPMPASSRIGRWTFGGRK